MPATFSDEECYLLFMAMSSLRERLLPFYSEWHNAYPHKVHPSAGGSHTMTMPDIETWNQFFKQGRRAGQEDVAKAILAADQSRAHETARHFLAAHEQKAGE